MKGFIIYEDYRGKEVVEAIKLGMVDYECKSDTSDGSWINNLSGVRKESTQARCNKDDTYDFEIGALISLMKMCGAKKAAEACCEAFPHETSGSIYRENKRYIKRIKELEEENESLKKEKEQIIVAKNILYNKLEKENKELHKNIDELFEDGKHAKSEVGRLSFEKHRLEEKVEKLQHEYDLCKNSERALKCSVDYLNKTIAKLNTAICGYKEDLNKATKRCEELEIKESILNKQEETINKKEEKISVYFGGRGTGKQYKALVELFKKIDQKKVDEAYKEAYNTTLPLWQKEVLNQMYGVYKESKEKTELPRTLDINGTVYRKSIQIKDFSNDQLDSLIEGSRAFTRKFDSEWLKPPTKRDEMWEKIFELHKESDVIIKVKKEDVNTFLHEIENRIPEITWYSCVKIFETKYTIGDIYEELKTCDEIYFRLHKRNKLSYTSDSHIYPYRELKPIDYLPPMRWDLFEKGRRIIRVNNDKLYEFMTKCSNELGGIMRPNLRRYKEFTHVFVMISDYHYDNKPTIYIMTPEDLVRNQHENPKKYSDKKIVDWEDVR